MLILQITQLAKEKEPCGYFDKTKYADGILPIDTYKKDVDDLIEGIKTLPRADGVVEIMVPGEPEDRVYQERVVKGIPLPPGTADSLKAAANRFEIELPSELR